MSAMPSPERFLDRDPDQLEQFLLQLARQDFAPPGARERTLSRVAAAAASAGLLTGAAGYVSRSSLAKATTWLVVKWLTVGLGAGLLTVGAAQGIAQLAHQKPNAVPSAAGRETSNGAVPVAEPRRSSAASLDAAPEPAPDTLNSLTGAAAALPVSTPKRNPAAEPPASARRTVPELEVGALTQELLLLESTRTALAAHAPAQALHSLDGYRTTFPSGSLQIEAEALRVEAVAQMGNHALAQRLAESFLTTHPTSPLGARVRSISFAARSAAQKP